MLKETEKENSELK